MVFWVLNGFWYVFLVFIKEMRHLDHCLFRITPAERWYLPGRPFRCTFQFCWAVDWTFRRCMRWHTVRIRWQEKATSLIFYETCFWTEWVPLPIARLHRKVRCGHVRENLRDVRRYGLRGGLYLWMGWVLLRGCGTGVISLPEFLKLLEEFFLFQA